ncbi:DarT ssDNA thymidine ADP-ribosyltransferase family protein [Rhizobium brockwellii]|uniref:DarT ssDNA thymidine ADP-ribosyltransferase family protein n=1 Tax=Rhizobium brockwellii TaxID=3019932 RepID=UPI003F961743
MSVDEFIAFIRQSIQHKTLYHFTDRGNFPSIEAHGLLSKEQLRAQGLWPPAATGGNALSQQLDLARGIDPYVSLCMTRNHRMKYIAMQEGRLTDPRYLAIEPDVLLIPGVLISLGVANANGAELLPVAQAIAQMDTEVVYERTVWSDPVVQARLQAAEKYEVLIPSHVPVEMITGYY